MNGTIALFSGNANLKLAEDIAKNLRIALGESTVSRFADGEIRVKIEENVRGKDVFVIQPTSPPTNDSIMELLILIDALKRASAKRITAVIAYYGYARQDRKTEGRTPITARLVADLISVTNVDRIFNYRFTCFSNRGIF